MKNLSVRKNIAMLASIIGMTIVCGVTAGCSKKSEEESLSQNEIVKEETISETPKQEKIIRCEHLIIPFSNVDVIFRECDGLSITVSENKTGCISYYVSDSERNNIIKYGSTQTYNYYVTGEEEHDKMLEIEEKAIENGAYVYKIEE